MDPILAPMAILTQIADTIIGTLAGDGTQELVSKLQGDPTKKALKKALGEALIRYVKSQPERKTIARPLLRWKSLLAEKDIANELAQVVKFVRAPDVALIGKRWHDELDNPPAGCDFTHEAQVLVNYFTDELKAISAFASVFELASLDSIDAHAEVSAEALAAIEKYLASLVSLMESQFEFLEQKFKGAPVGIHEHIRDFSLDIAEKTAGFVGRGFLFQEIQEFIDTNSRGYFFLFGKPGIGKSTILAKLVKDHGYLHHFNMRTASIDETSVFLQNICAQLITAYSLNYTSLPPEAAQDGMFLKRLFNEVSQKIGQNGKCVIIIDALDETKDFRLKSEANLLLLPQELPIGIFIVATSRVPKADMSLRITISEQKERELRQDESGNDADIKEYIQGQISNLGIQAYIHRHQVDDKWFIDHLAEKAQGNFMYLRLVLPEIECGHYQDRALDQIPAGLESYYDEHWRRIKQEYGLDWLKYRLHVVVALTVMREPVPITLIMKYSKVNDKHLVREVLHDFDQFLYKIEKMYDRQPTICYRWYHASFFDFISRKKDIAEERLSLIEGTKKVVRTTLDDLRRYTDLKKPGQE